MHEMVRAPVPVRPSAAAARIGSQPPGPGLLVTLLALAGVRQGAVVLDLTPGATVSRAAAAAAGRGGVVVSARPTALLDGLPAALRAGTVTHAFAARPGSRLLTALRPLLRTGARVAVSSAALEALEEVCTVAAYDVLHATADVEGLVAAVLRARPPS